VSDRERRQKRSSLRVTIDNGAITYFAMNLEFHISIRIRHVGHQWRITYRERIASECEGVHSVVHLTI
jgi:hypothetical protein